MAQPTPQVSESPRTVPTPSPAAPTSATSAVERTIGPVDLARYLWHADSSLEPLEAVDDLLLRVNTIE
ncbi:MAG TPA: hypothetical protein PLJ27_25110, partial [Polyangiaceae bacterium]|nr:hypothetical protein [Polyangiaceae bacterium]